MNLVPEDADARSDVSEQDFFDSINVDIIDDPLTIKEDEGNDQQEEHGCIRRSSRPNRGELPVKFSEYVVGVATHSIEEPSTYKQAISSGDRDSWKVAMDRSESKAAISRVFEQLKEHFEVVYLGDVKFFLGLDVQKENGVYSIGLTNYIDKLVARTGLIEAKVAKTPMDQGYLKDEVESKLLDDSSKYRSIVGALLYAAVCARPDIIACAALLGKKFSAPSENDWTAAKRAVRYLKGTRDWRLQLGEDHNGELVAFSDSDWAGDVGTCKSTTGFVIYYAGAAVSWANRRFSRDLSRNNLVAATT
ncbi:uncharacterized protein LOC131686845 [Topomyia yanbarensis]|uniref:uncharacterized protein LOC131686845 n=1 Tax=Topomyia yanbarensis TaxID=2498891 RepID=UPI00273CE880|nr:uncharacterized protein LOC131686845 [Topomyia yanbarensis]